MSKIALESILGLGFLLFFFVVFLFCFKRGLGLLLLLMVVMIRWGGKQFRSNANIETNPFGKLKKNEELFPCKSDPNMTVRVYRRLCPPNK